MVGGGCQTPGESTMSQIQFQRGEFLTFRAVSDIHLGQYEISISEGDYVEFDGQTLRYAGEDRHLPTLKGAIKVGWLVPEGEEGQYIPQPANITVHSAQQTTQSRTHRDGGRRMVAVMDDEREVGTVVNRQNRVASANAAGIGAHATIVAEDGSVNDGRVVGRFKTKAVADPVPLNRMGQVIKETEAVTRPRVVTAADLNPEPEYIEADEDAEFARAAAREAAAERAAAIAAERRAQAISSAKKVDPRISMPDRPSVTITPGMTPIGDSDDGEVVATVGSRTPTEKPARTARAEEPPVDAAIVAAKIEAIRAFVPGFDWDITEPWQVRVQKALDLKNNMPVLNAVLAIETDVVKKHVMMSLYGG